MVTIAYPIGDLVLSRCAVRFVLGASWNVTALRLLVVGLALMLVGDAIYAADVLERLGRDTLVRRRPPAHRGGCATRPRRLASAR